MLSQGSRWQLRKLTAVGNSYIGQLVLSWGTHQIFFVPHQSAKMILPPPGSPCTAHPQQKPFVTPSLNPDNKSHHPQVSLLFWCHLKEDHTSSLDNWRLSICTPAPLTWLKTYFQMSKSFTLALEKIFWIFMDSNLWLPQGWITPRGTLRPSPGWTMLPHWERDLCTSLLPFPCIPHQQGPLATGFWKKASD